ncbi:hypothetical protein M2418_002601 [Rhizobium sp. BIGb0125]|nr:hypothetical protein [Rhizobium sp. BIGb0125]
MLDVTGFGFQDVSARNHPIISVILKTGQYELTGNLLPSSKLVKLERCLKALVRSNISLAA